MRDYLTIKNDVSRRRCHHAKQCLERRAFPASVSSQQADKFSRENGKVHVFEYVDRAVMGVNASEL